MENKVVFQVCVTTTKKNQPTNKQINRIVKIWLSERCNVNCQQTLLLDIIKYVSDTIRYV